VRRFTAIILLVTAGAIILPAQGSSKWVRLGDGPRLHYLMDARGNRIMDFSHAGYMGGGVRLPVIAAARTLGPASGDNTASIQAALDQVSSLTPGADGFRGAVRLEPGTYEVAGVLKIGTSGVVLRGSGSAEGGTIIRMTGSPHRFLEMSGTGSWKPEEQSATVTDAYVPSGADSLHVEAVSGLRAGDTVLIQRPVTEAWVRFMGMDTLVRDGKPQTWIKAGTRITADRLVRAISGKQITFDVPLSDSLDAAFFKPSAASVVKYTFPGRIDRVGLESLRVTAPAQDVPITQRQYTLLQMNAASDAWVRDVMVEDTQNTITLGPSVRRVTLENVRIRHQIPFTAPAGPADIAISGTQILVHRCTVSGKGIWPVVTQAGVTGPNVILNFTSDENGIAPHQRWATGLLVDSSRFLGGTERRQNIAFSNRTIAGSGHGWTVGWAVAWNVTADYLLIQQPPGAKNWCIGCTGRFANTLWNGEQVPAPDVPSETIESPGVPVSPSSLYLSQLRDRLGSAALANIGY
jgi:hypothetical protein